ncbi:hypothetical protein BCAR13_110164 [Paraburkholderia caribensis]|nr:hypothetical protein BCAR13_110164 [Paraburkholderia caribensis]
MRNAPFSVSIRCGPDRHRNDPASLQASVSPLRCQTQAARSRGLLGQLIALLGNGAIDHVADSVYGADHDEPRRPVVDPDGCAPCRFRIEARVQRHASERRLRGRQRLRFVIEQRCRAARDIRRKRRQRTTRDKLAQMAQTTELAKGQQAGKAFHESLQTVFS